LAEDGWQGIFLFFIFLIPALVLKASSLQIRFCYFSLFSEKKKVTNPFIGCATIELRVSIQSSELISKASFFLKFFKAATRYLFSFNPANLKNPIESPFRLH
jgi:hypothetical protein